MPRSGPVDFSRPGCHRTTLFYGLPWYKNRFDNPVLHVRDFAAEITRYFQARLSELPPERSVFAGKPELQALFYDWLERFRSQLPHGRIPNEDARKAAPFDIEQGIVFGQFRITRRAGAAVGAGAAFTTGFLTATLPLRTVPGSG